MEMAEMEKRYKLIIHQQIQAQKEAAKKEKELDSLRMAHAKKASERVKEENEKDSVVDTVAVEENENKVSTVQKENETAATPIENSNTSQEVKYKKMVMIKRVKRKEKIGKVIINTMIGLYGVKHATMVDILDV